MTTVRRRSAPLHADDQAPDHRQTADARPSAAGGATAPSGIGHDVTARTRTETDRRFFAEAVRGLRTGGGSLNLSERTLMIAGGVLAPLGLLFVLLGWIGASRTPNIFEQVPYMISGGLFGLGLVFLGSFFYFAHWITELVKESRAQSAALLQAIDDLKDRMGGGAVAVVTDHAATGARAAVAAPELVATANGSMAHRPDCVVVAGKAGLRRVSAGDSLMSCKLCDPGTDHADG